MARPPEDRVRLRALYVHQRMPLEAAAEQVGISYGTARRWKSEAETGGDDWERARTAARMSGQNADQLSAGILEDYLLLHAATMEAVKADDGMAALDKAECISRLADAFTKVMSALAKSGPKLNRLAVATDVITKMAAWVATKRPDLAPAMAEVLEPFAADLARVYGSK
jgi:transposase-like protein